MISLVQAQNAEHTPLGLALEACAQRPVHRQQYEERALQKRFDVVVRPQVGRDVVGEPVSRSIVQQGFGIGEDGRGR